MTHPSHDRPDTPSTPEIPPRVPMTRRHPRTVLARGTFREYTRIEKIITAETTGGFILLGATVLALIFANTPLADFYHHLQHTHLGFTLGPLDLDLSLAHWAADGLLTVFFFLAGLELKQEFTVGDLRDRSKALVPIVAAAGGVALPALIFSGIALFGPAEAFSGWAIPAATDIAFAVAVLALLAPHLPSALRTFLLTLAIVDDLIAILIIAIFYSSDLNLWFLAAAVVPVALYWLLATKAEPLFKISYAAAWLLLAPIGLVTWALFYNSGVHATIAGVVLAFMVPVTARSQWGEKYSLAHTLEHRLRPLSSGVAVPLFAFFSAGVTVGGVSGLLDAWTTTVALGVIVGLVLGKIIGIVGTTFLITRLQHANLDPDIKWIDLTGVAAVAGIGFTVSLLVSELSFAGQGELEDWAKVGVLTASALAALVGAAILVPRNRLYAAIAESEKVDANADGVPDKFEDG